MIIILSAPSGGGKTSLAKNLLTHDKNLALSISATTRTARSTEQEGQDYFFKTKQEFTDLKLADGLLESAEIYGHDYGTPKKYIEELLAQGKDILFDIDYQGTKQLKSRLPKMVVSIFIMPPSIKSLKKRLQHRNQDQLEEIEKRLKLAKTEIAQAHEYDYIVINDNFDQATNDILDIITKERSKRKNKRRF